MITIRRQAAVATQMPALRKRLADFCAASASLRSSAWINFHEHAPGTLSLVREHKKKVGPSGIVNRFSEHAARESFDVEIFDRDQAMLINNLSRFFMVEVTALIANVVMKSLKQQDGFASAIGIFLSTRYSSLQASEFCLGGSEPTRIVDRGSVTECGEGRQSDIN